ncbi:MAG TPA: hypothetical protein ENK37_11340, partial [Oceanithermus profundus]|nr:hypothetical protein [Oceanithermus profundus]
MQGAAVDSCDHLPPFCVTSCVLLHSIRSLQDCGLRISLLRLPSYLYVYRVSFLLLTAVCDRTIFGPARAAPCRGVRPSPAPRPGRRGYGAVHYAWRRIPLRRARGAVSGDFPGCTCIPEGDGVKCSNRFGGMVMHEGAPPLTVGIEEEYQLIDPET